MADGTLRRIYPAYPKYVHPESRRHALGIPPHGLGVMCEGCYRNRRRALITAMTLRNGVPLCPDCADLPEWHS